MFQHILLPTDGSILSKAAVDKGIALARDLNARVTVLMVVEPYYMFAGAADSFVGARESYDKQVRQEAAAVLSEAQRKAAEQGVQCAVVQTEDEHPFKAIIDTARKSGCDLIAMASHGRRGMAGLVLGSETHKVLTHSTIPVLVYR